MKKYKCFAICGLLTMLLLSACSSNQSTTSSPSQSNSSQASSSPQVSNDVKPHDPVEIKVWGRIGSISDPINEMIAEFQQEYPYITVDYSSTSIDQYMNIIQAGLSGNDLPDIFTAIANFPTAQLVKLGAIRPLNDIVPKDQMDAYIPGVWSEGTTMLNGDIYGIPLFDPQGTAMVMYYNKAALQQVGLTEQDIPKTWDELVQFGKKVQAASNGKTYGLVVGVKANSTYMPFAVTQMATAISPDVSTDAYYGQFNYKTGKYEYDAPGNVQTIEFFKKLLDEKVLHPNSLIMKYREGTSLMEAGQAILTIDSYTYGSVIEKENWDNIGVAPIPTQDGQPSHFSFTGGTDKAFMVSNSTKHYDEVKLFLDFMKDHLYPKIMASGSHASPLVSQNATIEIENPVAREAVKLKEGIVKLVPVPGDKNAAAIDVGLEMSGKLPKITLADIIEGYLSGQLKDPSEVLGQLTTDFNNLFTSSLNKVQQAGASISLEDYIYPDWNPLDNYKTRK